MVSICGFDFFFDPRVVFEKDFSYPAFLLLCCFGLVGLYFYIVNFYLHCSKKMKSIISSFLNVLKFPLWANIWIIFVSV